MKLHWMLTLTWVASVPSGLPALQAAEVPVADGLRVSITLLHLISSETSTPGDRVRLAVAENVTVDDAVVIKRGASVQGTVVDAVPHRLGGRSGRIVIAVNETVFVDGGVVRLRASPSKRDDARASAVEVTTPAGARLRWAAEGTRFEAFVDGEYRVTVPHEAPPHEPTPPAAPDVLTNDDIVKLVAAGVGDEVVIAKIRRSEPAFRVQADDLIELKKAGVSDRVVIAMIEAARAASRQVPPRV